MSMADDWLHDSQWSMWERQLDWEEYVPAGLRGWFERRTSCQSANYQVRFVRWLTDNHVVFTVVDVTREGTLLSGVWQIACERAAKLSLERHPPAKESEAVRLARFHRLVAMGTLRK